MTDNDDYRDTAEERYNRELMHPADELAGLRRLLRAGPDSVVSIELDACNDDELAEQLARHPGVRAQLIDPGTGHGFPIYRYSGPIGPLVGWLDDAYADGSGWPWYEQLAAYLYPEGVAS